MVGRLTLPPHPSRIAEVERRLELADSYSRADAILECVWIEHPRALELLGTYWTACDRYPPAVQSMLLRLKRRHGFPLLRAMDANERAWLGALPQQIGVWRGCYEHNRRGYSWSLAREVAERFPRLNRYRQDGTPLLIEGELAKCDVAFLKLDRQESEIVTVPDYVKIRAQHALSSTRGRRG